MHTGFGQLCYRHNVLIYNAGMPESRRGVDAVAFDADAKGCRCHKLDPRHTTKIHKFQEHIANTMPGCSVAIVALRSLSRVPLGALGGLAEAL